MRLMSFQDFKKIARPGGGVPVRVPLIGEVPMDLVTPLAVYKAFEKERHRFLLESVEGGEKWGRYSISGLYPSLIFKSRGRGVEILENGKKRSFESSDPLNELKKCLGRYRFVDLPGLPRFTGGAVGYVSYETVRFFERIPDLRKPGKPGIEIPDLYFVIPQIVLVTDALEQKLLIVYDARIDSPAKVKGEYEKGRRLIEKVWRAIHAGRDRAAKKLPLPKWKASITEREHAQGIARIKEYIAAGDITQTVYAIRFQAASRLNDLDLYRALRRINPSPYMFHLKFPELALVGASPETMVRLEDGEMTLRPIAGTRKRGKNDAEDKALEEDLLNDEKERAEHIMLVDLGRNDLGRVAAAGTVKVDELMSVERYSHVMHIVSNVRARLAEGKDAFDVLRATFPAGTLSGSPKIRAMEIIEELEPMHRSFYGGCVGYFSFSGNMEMAITIRSALLKDGKITVQAGGGIVADSVAVTEYQEVLNKSKAVMRAVEMVCQGPSKG